MSTREQVRRIRDEVTRRPLADLLDAYDQIHHDQSPADDNLAYLDGIVIDATKKAIVDAIPTAPAELVKHIRALSAQYDNGAAARPSWKLQVRLATDIATSRHPGAERAMADWEPNPRFNSPLEALIDHLEQKIR